MAEPVIYDALNDPPRAVEWPFELAARRIADDWIDAGRVEATAEHLRLATPFLHHCGLTVEVLPGLEVRLVSATGRATVMSREAIVVTALRCLATSIAQRGGPRIARAA